MDRLEQLTARLQSALERDKSDHPFDGSDVHLDSCLACLDRFVELRDGSSGAPLLDDTGAVVGIVAGSAAETQGVYFAVSVQHVRELLPR